MKQTAIEKRRCQKAKFVSKMKNGFLIDPRYPDLKIRQSFMMLAGQINTYKTTVALKCVLSMVEQTRKFTLLKLKKVITFVSSEFFSSEELTYALLANLLRRQSGVTELNFSFARNKKLVDAYFNTRGFEFRIVFTPPAVFPDQLKDDAFDVHHIVIDTLSGLGFSYSRRREPHQFESMHDLLRHSSGTVIAIGHLTRQMPTGGNLEKAERPLELIGVESHCRFLSDLEMHTSVEEDGVWLTAVRNKRGPSAMRYHWLQRHV